MSIANLSSSPINIFISMSQLPLTIVLFDPSRSRTLSATANTTSKPSPTRTTPSLPRPTANTTTASATRAGPPTQRKSPSTSTESSTCPNRKCRKIPWRLRSANFPRIWLRSAMSRGTLLFASVCTGIRPRAPTVVLSGGVFSSCLLLLERVSSRCGG